MLLLWTSAIACGAAHYPLAPGLGVVAQLRPGPDGRALPCLRSVLDQFVEPRITAAMPVGFNSHAACSCSGQAPSLVTRHMIRWPGPARNTGISACLSCW